MKKALFITGTGTQVGKTVVSALLCSSLKQKGFNVGYFKPIACGEEKDYQTIRELAQIDQIAQPSYDFKKPLAPWRAAQLESQEIVIDKIIQDWKKLEEGYWIIEGVGGLEVPINQNETVMDLIRALEAPIILVSSTELGTINHTLLSLKNLKHYDLRGLIFVGRDSYDSIESIKNFTTSPILAKVDWIESFLPYDFSMRARKIFLNPENLFDEEVIFNDDPFLSYKKNWYQKNIILNSGTTKTLFRASDHLSDLDKKYIWHPFTQHGSASCFPQVVSASGSKIKLADGRELIDAISSWWVTLHGHGEPHISAAISDQVDHLEQVIFAGFTHEPAARLVQLLSIPLFPLSKFFFSDNGSTSVEVALKMSVQYFYNQGEKRDRFLSLYSGYHGDTLGAMAVSSPQKFQKPFSSLLPKVDFVNPDDVESLENLITQNSYAALIVEPLIQGAGGMKLYSVDFLQKAKRLCEQTGTLFIVDEIFTGFFRTGKMFAYHHAGIRPDIVTLSKGLTGGFLPLGLTVTSENIFEKFLSKDFEKAFLHGHSFTANPIACRAAVASYELLVRSKTLSQIEMISEITKKRIENLKGHSKILNPRYLGTIGAFDLKEGEGYFSRKITEKISKEALKRGVFLRPLGNVIYTVPPYCIKEQDLNYIYDVIEEIL